MTVSKKISAIGGFLIFIACVIGIAILIYEDGTSLSSSFPTEATNNPNHLPNADLDLKKNSPERNEEEGLVATRILNRNDDEEGLRPRKNMFPFIKNFAEDQNRNRMKSENVAGAGSGDRKLEEVIGGDRRKKIINYKMRERETEEEKVRFGREEMKNKEKDLESAPDDNEFSISRWIPSSSANPVGLDGSRGMILASDGLQENKITPSNIMINNEEVPNKPEDDYASYENDQYDSSAHLTLPGQQDENEDKIQEEEVEDDDNAQGIELTELFDLAANLYASGAKALDFQKVISEAVNQGNQSRLLAELNQLYKRPQSSSSASFFLPSPSPLSPPALLNSSSFQYSPLIDSNENSLTAFIFMSFGVFLLNQIHILVSSENEAATQRGGGEGFGRNLNSFENGVEDKSDLDILFKPPQILLNEEKREIERKEATGASNWPFYSSANTFSSIKTLEKKEEEEDDLEEVGKSSNLSLEMHENFFTTKHVNNMFRALLNLGNAYTKNSEALECIWSLYCQDLDKTAGKEGLYGIAARINSIGLRLIMDQIPADLIVDVTLQSLLSWQELPCSSMFPKCDGKMAIENLIDSSDSRSHFNNSSNTPNSLY